MNAKSKETQEDIELLLPWHAAGTLSRRDAERVERALANDNELATRYEVVREELGEAIRLNESLGAPSARAMQTLFAKIDAEPARTPRTSFNLGAWLSSFVSGFQPRTLAYAGAAAAIVVLLQAGVLTSMLMQGGGTYGVASYESQQPAGKGAFILIRFKPQASSTDITKFLQEHNAKIVDGPTSGSGMYRLRVAENALPPAELAIVIKGIQQNPVVGFTVPAATP